MILLLVGAAAAATLVVGRDAPTVQATVDLAAPGDKVVLPDGEWPGPVRIDKLLTLTSDGGALDGRGVGTIVDVVAPGVVIDGLRVHGSGRNLETTDACIRLAPTAEGAVVRDVEAWDCLWGIWVHTTRRARIEDNHIAGIPGDVASLKGNGIHLFDAGELIVRGNTVTDARDGIYVSATENSLIEGNTASHQRYGIHYMYSFDNTVRGNVTSDNSGGIALMQSHRLIVEDNVCIGNHRQGILFRDTQYSTIRRNRVEHNGEGMFFFSSLDNVIEDNVILGNEIGARIWAGTERNTIRNNAFVGNRQQIYYVAAKDQRWDGETGGNYWSDYLGWDQDSDGRGDHPYEVDSLVAGLLYKTPAAVLLLNSPTLEILSGLQRQLPALDIPTIIDVEPRMAPLGGAP